MDTENTTTWKIGHIITKETNRVENTMSAEMGRMTETIRVDTGEKITSMKQEMIRRMERMEERIVTRVANQDHFMQHEIGSLRRKLEDPVCGGLLVCHILNKLNLQTT